MKCLRLFLPILLAFLFTSCAMMGGQATGSLHIRLEADLPADQTVNASDMDAAVKIIADRIRGFGIPKFTVMRDGERQIAVAIEGISDATKLDQIASVVKQTGLLELVDMSSISQQEALSLVDQTIQTDWLRVDTSTTNGTGDLSQRIWPTALTGAELKNASVMTDRNGQYQVTIEFNPDGAEKIAEFTGNHTGDVLAIVFDKKVVSVPVINAKIEAGKAVITGSFTYDSANQLALLLRYGALPIPLRIVEVTAGTPSP